MKQNSNCKNQLNQGEVEKIKGMNISIKSCQHF